MPEIAAETDGTAPAITATNTNLTDQAGPGVHARSRAAGVIGESTTWMGVFGESTSTTGGHGVMGRATAGGAGAVGESVSTGPGVIGDNVSQRDDAGAGVLGRSRAAGVVGVSETWMGVFGESKSTTGGHGVMGLAKGSGNGVHGRTEGGGFAGFFEGKVGVTADLEVNGSVQVLGDVQLVGADLAEEFAVVRGGPIEAGHVVVLAGDDLVELSQKPYDRAVAGVVSGAGGYRPALVLDKRGYGGRRALALSGKVWCMVDADSEPVHLGDLLTTSSTPGHAMRASDQRRGFGAIIGKALGNLTSGRALLPVLVALH